MLIYLILVLEILILNFLRRMGRLSKIAFCLILGISFVLITGLRSNNVGSDTTLYYLNFKEMAEVPFKEILYSEKRDKLFYIVSWLISNTTGSFVLFTILTAVMFYYPVMKLFYKYSDDCGLSCLILLAFNFFQFSMTGMRQTIAFGFSILFFLELRKEKISIWKSAIYIILGICFHRSCIIALLLPLLKSLGKNKIFVIAATILIPIFFIFRNEIISSLDGVFEYLGFEEIEGETAGAGMTTFLVYLALTVIGLFLLREDENKEFSLDELILIIIMGTAMQALVLSNSIFFRIAWYFAIYFTIHIPKITAKSILIKHEARIVELLVYLAVLFMYLFITKGSATVLPYEFFWQGN